MAANILFIYRKAVFSLRIQTGNTQIQIIGMSVTYWVIILSSSRGLHNFFENLHAAFKLPAVAQNKEGSTYSISKGIFFPMDCTLMWTLLR